MVAGRGGGGAGLDKGGATIPAVHFIVLQRLFCGGIGGFHGLKNGRVLADPFPQGHLEVIGQHEEQLQLLSEGLGVRHGAAATCCAEGSEGCNAGNVWRGARAGRCGVGTGR